MAESKTASITLQETLFRQVETLAHRLDISSDELGARAIADFVSAYQDAHQESETDVDERLIINQGDVYWVQAGGAGAEPGIPHPHVVVQDNVFNHSRVDTVIACAVTSNIKRASLPGNVLLDAGEANLPRPSVVEVSKVSAIKKTGLGAPIGTLSEARIAQILAGLRFLQSSYFR